jgi:hypothetical protein
MKPTLIAIALFATLLTNGQSIVSPSRTHHLQFGLTSAGELQYQLSYKGKDVIKPSKLGFELLNIASLTRGFSITRIDSSSSDSSWEPVWGEVKTIRNNYKELAATVSHRETGISMVIRFRLYDDGVGFRFEFPRQPALNHFVVKDEKTQFNLAGDHKAFWIPGDYDTNEYGYYTTKLSQAEPEKGRASDEISAQWKVPGTVQTPLMMKSAEGLYINIHEAALVNYPAMLLEVDRKTFSLASHLVPDNMGNKAYLQTPFNTPWRTVLVSDKATDLLASKTILNLNEPTALKDVSWIKPMKYVGIWWEMHANVGTWNYADTTNLVLKNTDWAKLKPNGKHSANTANVKRYIDFAASNGFGGVLVEGWNVGWEDWYGQWKEEVFDFVTPYPDFDVKEIHRYAASKGVQMIMHHETSASATNYDRRMDEAYKFMVENGYPAVKTGYVGRIIPRGEHHDSQWMVNHYLRAAQKTAASKLMLDAHEPTRPTGLHRTYPNWLASEAARGNEFNAWSSGNAPDHETILPFTRLMGGPMDYTPGIFEVKMSYYDKFRTPPPSSPNPNQVHTTLTKQLALYITMYSPLQMAADLPQNYERYPDAFQFIKDVAVDWDDTRIIEAEPGDFVTISRKAKGKDEWFLGAITDENSRTALANLGFLDAGKTYRATIYADGPGAHWKENPKAYTISTFVVTTKTILKLQLAAGGGAAVSLKPVDASEAKKLKKYK